MYIFQLLFLACAVYLCVSEDDDDCLLAGTDCTDAVLCCNGDCVDGKCTADFVDDGQLNASLAVDSDSYDTDYPTPEFVCSLPNENCTISDDCCFGDCVEISKLCQPLPPDDDSNVE